MIYRKVVNRVIGIYNFTEGEDINIEYSLQAERVRIKRYFLVGGALEDQIINFS